MKHICIWLIRLYQKWLSPLKRNPTCRFYPTCSAFAIEAFQKRGFFAGVLLTFFRILRCNPFCPGGYDPVPEKGITVRSYYANRKRWITEQENNDCDGGADADLSESDAIEPNAPGAGGNSQDRGEDAANQGDTPPRACVRYDHTR